MSAYLTIRRFTCSVLLFIAVVCFIAIVRAAGLWLLAQVKALVGAFTDPLCLALGALCLLAICWNAIPEKTP